MANNFHSGNGKDLQVGCHERVFVGPRDRTLEALAQKWCHWIRQEQRTAHAVRWTETNATIFVKQVTVPRKDKAWWVCDSAGSSEEPLLTQKGLSSMLGSSLACLRSRLLGTLL